MKGKIHVNFRSFTVLGSGPTMARQSISLAHASWPAFIKETSLYIYEERTILELRT